MNKIRAAVPGIALTLIISVISFLTASMHQSFDSLVISIIFGMLVANILMERELFRPGMEMALKIFLPIGIGLYGLQLTFGAGDIRLIPIVASTTLAIFVSTYLISRGFGIKKRIALLLGSGLAICGASAIAVISPLIDSKKEETSVSLISVMTVGLTGMLVYSFLPDMLGLSLERFSFMVGSTLPMLGQVKNAASALGTESLSMAVNIKLLRISFLTFFALGFIIAAGRKEKRLKLPWFMAVFFGLAVTANLTDVSQGIKDAASWLSKFSLTTALGAIGLSIDFDSIGEEGPRPLIAVFVSLSIIVLIVYILINVLNV